MRLLIVGFGSIGKRHHRNALSLGVKEEAIEIVDPLVSDSPPLDDALSRQPDGILICTPFSTHYDIARDALRHTDAAVFIEKPLCESLDDATSLVEMSIGRITQVGYCWRFHDTVLGAMSDINTAVAEGKRPAHLKLTCYSCRSLWPGLASTYGDVIYEASHELDLASHFFGATRVTFAKVEPSSAWITLRAPLEHQEDLQIDCELKYVIHPREERRTLTVAWEDGTKSGYNLRHPPSAIAPMYREELNVFMQALTSRKPSTTAATLADGASVVEIIHHAKRHQDLSDR
jgi:predicted dehydrogenase